MKAKPKPLSITVKRFCEKHTTPDPRAVKQGIQSILSGEKRHLGGHLTVCFVDDALIRDLNRRYLNIDGTTDVLAFNYGTRSAVWAADIVICVDEASRNCREYKTTFESELFLYVAHGLLHLLGYDDESPRQQQLMRQKEARYLRCFEVPPCPSIKPKP